MAAACADGSCAVQPLSRQDKRNEFDRDPANAPEIHKGLRDDLLRIGQHFFDHASPVADMEESLHDAWDELIHAARIIPAESPEHDRLVNLVLEMREFGLLARAEGDAVVSNGQRLWTDVPYLAEEIQDSWTQESRGFAVDERQNLAALTAKLCAVGVCSADMARCALWLFREALETHLPLTGESPGGDATKVSTSLSLAHLLPACLAWLNHGNFKLAKLCASGQNLSTSATHSGQRVSTSPGPLAARAGVPQLEFSVERWLFWRRRLGELYLGGIEQVAEPARKCFEVMVSTGSAMGLEIPGEKKYLERLFEALDKEVVARDMKECVGPEDIRIDPAWADDN
ncbi:hypothetical protein HRG_006812 [Hirsutella rhossiliensis]|uniref:Uncharacterized protein n=1 Tax=Hirsutella rhossiliensis TaxID=111463 RepID=A0A9P8MVE1_9HYPO|nr:uncharacterized protein HRG_06812 [Hirsutella rhossiliensis]KAH0961732.1 hypothetical protein HRG_06812 [Hirsutella rhossiliensis]